MTTTINADTVVGGAIVTGDASGELALQAAGATKLTVNSSGVTLAAPLPVLSGGTGATSLSGITVGTATNATTATTATTATNLAGGSNGTIPYQSASGTTQMLTAGSSGQFLKSNGASAPSWVAASSGALTFLSSVTASSSSTVDLETTIDSTYGTYLIVATGVRSSIDNAQLQCRFKVAGSYYAADYYYVGVTTNSGSTAYSSVTNGGVASIEFGSLLGNSSDRGFNFNFFLFSPSNTTTVKTVRWDGAGFGGGGYLDNFQGNGAMYNTAAFNGVRFFPSSGTISVGTFRLYGISNS
jgi:hypothetical protein